MHKESLRKLLENPDYDYREISLGDITPDYVLEELKVLENWFNGTKQEGEYRIRFVRLKRLIYFNKLIL
jgi:hypothetical protein